MLLEQVCAPIPPSNRSGCRSRRFESPRATPRSEQRCYAIRSFDRPVFHAPLATTRFRAEACCTGRPVVQRGPNSAKFSRHRAKFYSGFGPKLARDGLAHGRLRAIFLAGRLVDISQLLHVSYNFGKQMAHIGQNWPNLSGPNAHSRRNCWITFGQLRLVEFAGGCLYFLGHVASICSADFG